LVDWEGLKAEGQSFSPKLLLPLGEIGIMDWRHCVSLLPLIQVVLAVSRVKTHHLGLK